MNIQKYRNLDRTKLENLVNDISGTIKTLKTKYDSIPFENLKSKMARAYNRSCEAQNGSFIIIVVGPVKSGKSTFVNLIAGAHVSPTHYLECTIRPSIIYNDGKNSENEICSYRSTDMQHKVEQVDQIIDYIRGIEPNDDFDDIQKDCVPLTDDNLENKVALDSDCVKDDDTLITTISTNGGLLMKKDIFVVDMPGFDGVYANLDNPLYDTVMQRADLIIFVQSSNSAISKVSTDFFSKLKQNNANVPVILMHNIYESDYWRAEDERKNKINEQIKHAEKRLGKAGFEIKQSYSINLAMVEDATNNRIYSERLDEERERFDKIQLEIQDKLSNGEINAIRFVNCLSRTAQQLEQLDDSTYKILESRHNKRAEYEENSEYITKIKNDPNVSIEIFDNDIELPDINASLSELVDQWEEHTKKIWRASNVNKKLGEMVAALQKEIERIVERADIPQNFKRKIDEKVEDARRYIIDTVQKRFSLDWPKPTLPEFADIPINSLWQNLSLKNLLKDNGFDVDNAIKPGTIIFGSYSPEVIKDKMDAIRDLFIGETKPSGKETKSIIKQDVYPAIRKLITQYTKQYLDDTNKTLSRYVDILAEMQQIKVIEDIDSFDTQTNTLEQLKQDINSVLNQI